ncbi:MAG: hypothetical protein ACK40G_17670 [Cytophagaceae bacterium]
MNEEDFQIKAFDCYNAIYYYQLGIKYYKEYCSAMYNLKSESGIYLSLDDYEKLYGIISDPENFNGIYNRYYIDFLRKKAYNIADSFIIRNDTPNIYFLFALKLVSLTNYTMYPGRPIEEFLQFYFSQNKKINKNDFLGKVIVNNKALFKKIEKDINIEEIINFWLNKPRRGKKRTVPGSLKWVSNIRKLKKLRNDLILHQFINPIDEKIFIDHFTGKPFDTYINWISKPKHHLYYFLEKLCINNYLENSFLDNHGILTSKHFVYCGEELDNNKIVNLKSNSYITPKSKKWRQIFKIINGL